MGDGWELSMLWATGLSSGEYEYRQDVNGCEVLGKGRFLRLFPHSANADAVFIPQCPRAYAPDCELSD